MMSRHTSRKERWTMLSAKEYRSAFGAVNYRAGAWEGKVRYEIQSEDGILWHPEETYVGRFKRPRNAMIAVEDKAREISRRFRDKVKIEIED